MVTEQWQRLQAFICWMAATLSGIALLDWVGFGMWKCFMLNEEGEGWKRVFLGDGRAQVTAITRLGDKEQFNSITPLDGRMPEASEWLLRKWRWRMGGIVWVVHHMHSTLDRAVEQAKRIFHDDLTNCGA